MNYQLIVSFFKILLYGNIKIEITIILNYMYILIFINIYLCSDISYIQNL